MPYQKVEVDKRKGVRGKRMPKNINLIWAGVKGYCMKPGGKLAGPYTVQPAAHGSFQPACRGYKWITLDEDGRLVYIPFRLFLVDCQVRPEELADKLENGPADERIPGVFKKPCKEGEKERD